MLRVLISILIFVFMLIFQGVSVAGTPNVLYAGVSLAKEVPSDLMGTWRVAAKLTNTDSPQNFKSTSVDIWNLSRHNDVIKLSNPFSGASASINVSYVNKNSIKFTKVGDYNNQKLTDCVEITIDGNSFRGVNTLSLETYSEKDKSLINEKKAIYQLYGEKISGADVLD